MINYMRDTLNMNNHADENCNNEDPKAVGFMRDRSMVMDEYNCMRMHLHYDRDRMNFIKDHVTAREYEMLQRTTFMSSKKTIIEYINLLQKFVDDGVFDDTCEKYIGKINNNLPDINALPNPNICIEKQLSDMKLKQQEDDKSHKLQLGQMNPCENNTEDNTTTAAYIAKIANRWIEQNANKNLGIQDKPNVNVMNNGPYIEISLEQFGNLNKNVTEKIHRRLRGHQKYIESSIVLNDDKVILYINELTKDEIAMIFNIIQDIIFDLI